jgi:dihydrofolate reductase
MNSIPKVAVSRTLERAEWNNTTLINKDVVDELKALKQKSTRDTFVFGSANLSATLIENNLFDEYRLALAPVILGAGKPLFPLNQPRRDLKLLDSRALSNGGVILRYVPLA